MADARVTVHSEARIDRIEPEVHGHFSEHLGRCVYDGLYSDDTADGDGYRDDVVDLLDDLDIPVLRWPGGCFADDYHWEDGVGPVSDRPRRRNLFWAQGRDDVPEESNAFGTDEFLQLCERIDTKPYLAANVGSGDPQEAADWMEYCSYDGDTELADRRRENGHEDPYEVPYWGVGNENWGCGGQMHPEQYAREFRRFATYMGSMDNLLLDQEVDLIACGFENHEWNRLFLEEVANTAWGVEFPLDHLTLHHYYGRAMNVAESDEDGYDRLLSEAMDIDEHIERLAAAVDAVATTRDIGVIIDEWGTWHPEAVPENGLEQPGTVLDALSAGAVLNVFNHHADVMTMSNIAQTVNVLQCLIETDGDEAWARPTYRVFDLFAPHKGNDAVTTTVDAPSRDVADDELELVNASASVADDGSTYVTVTNLDCRTGHSVEIAIDALDDATVGGDVLFAGQDAGLEVDASNADAFASESLDVDVEGDTLYVDLDASTVAAITVE